MPIEREDLEIEETDEQKEARENEEARQAELDQARKDKHDAEVKAARAEGEAEALKRGVSTVPAATPQWTDEQWEAEGAKRGLSGPQLKAQVEVSGEVTKLLTKPLQDRAEAAEREAKEAKEETRRNKAEGKIAAIEKDFYDKNPELSARKADVEDFLNDLSAEVRNDPEKFKKALEKAKSYARGKAREAVSTRRSGAPQDRGNNQDRGELDDEQRRANDDVEVDTSDLDNDGAKGLIERIARNPGPGDPAAGPSLRDMPIEKAYAASQRRDGRGVSIDESGDFARGAKRNDESLRRADPLGGRRS